MDVRNSSPGGMPFQGVLRTGICLVLIGAVVLALHLIGGWTQAPEIFINLHRNTSAITETEHTGSNPHDRLRFAVATMVSAEETFYTYRQLVERVSRDVGRKGFFVMRPSNEQVRLKLEWGEVDVALVCTGTYLHGMLNHSIKLLVQPELEDEASYRSLLIVPSDSHIRTWEELHDTIVAFTDHESFTGYLLPSTVLMDLGHIPDTFFRKIVYTSSNDRSILAVSSNAVEAAVVDSLVWFSMLRQIPSLGKRLRIIWQSQPYGPPPVVIPKDLDQGLAQALEKSLLALHEDEEGRRILSSIGIKRFVPANSETYTSAMKLYKRYQSQRGAL